MHCSKFILSLIATSAVCAASPMPEPQIANAVVLASTLSTFSGTKGKNGVLVPGQVPEGQNTQNLQKKQAVAAVVAITATAVLAKVAEIAIEIGADTLKNLGKWNEVHETFTKTVVTELGKRNPDYTKYHAAAQYNKGNRLKNPQGIAAFASAKLTLGLLHTDYDCMLIASPNAFWTDSDGGYINLAYRYDNHCTSDANTGDLTCN